MPSPSRVEGSFPRFGPFEIRGEIARGGMGVVYRAHDPRLGREVALKVLRPERNPSPQARERFRREASAAGKLDHPNIVKVHEAGVIEGLDYYVMDLVRGVPLDEFVHAEAPEASRRIAIVRDIARALQAAHRAGIIHRDIKPQNILVEGGVPRLTDFGLAKLAEEGVLTRTGQVIGTPFYMSPEQARGDVRALDARSDVFSLGVVLYEMLTGRRPFEGTTPTELYLRIAKGQVQPPSRLVLSLSRDVDRVILRALEKEPSDRYPDMEELAGDLDRLIAGERIKTAGGSSLRRAARRVVARRGLLLIAVAGAVASVVAFALLTTLAGQEPVDRNALAIAHASRLRAALAQRPGPNATLALAPLGILLAEGSDLAPLREGVPDLAAALADALRAAGHPREASSVLGIVAPERASPRLAVRRAEALLAAGDPQAAALILETSTDPAAIPVRARALIDAGRPEEAERVLGPQVALLGSPDLVLLRAESRLRRGNTSGAIEDLDLAEPLRGMSARFAMLQAEAMEARGDPISGVLAYMASLLARTADPEIEAAYGERLLHLGRPDVALPYLTQAAAARPDRLDVLRHLAEAHIARGDPDAAIAALRPAALATCDASLLGALGEALHLAGRDDEARPILERAVYRGDALAARTLAFAALAADPPDVREAARCVPYLAARARTDPAAEGACAAVEAHLRTLDGRPDDALRLLAESVLPSDPGPGGAADRDPEALALRGLLVAASSPEAARADLDRADGLFRAPAYGGPLLDTGTLLLGAADYPGRDASVVREMAGRAARLFELLCRRCPGWALAWRYRGQALALVGDAAGARVAFRRAALLDPFRPDPLVLEARLLAEGGGAPERSRATSLLRTAIDLGAPPEARLDLARLLAAEGDAAGALAEARRGVDDLRARAAPPRTLAAAFGTLATAARAAGDVAAVEEAEAAGAAANAAIQRASDLARQCAALYWEHAYTRSVEAGIQALGIDPEVPGAHRYIGKALAQLGRPMDAIVHGATELMRQPNEAWELVRLLEELGEAPVDKDRLYDTAARLAAESPENPACLFLRLVTLEIQLYDRPADGSLTHEALFVSSEIRRLAPGSVASWLSDALALARFGSRDASEEATAMALQLAGPVRHGRTPEDPGPFGAYFWSAMVYMRLGTPADQDRAYRLLQDAVDQGAAPGAEWRLHLWNPIAGRPLFAGRR